MPAGEERLLTLVADRTNGATASTFGPPVAGTELFDVPMISGALPHRASQDLTRVNTVMDQCRATLGRRCVLGNNSLRVPETRTDYDTLRATVAGHGAPIYFQTEKSAAFTTCRQLLDTLDDRAVANPAPVQSAVDYSTRCTPGAIEGGPLE